MFLNIHNYCTPIFKINFQFLNKHNYCTPHFRPKGGEVIRTFMVYLFQEIEFPPIFFKKMEAQFPGIGNYISNIQKY